MDTAVGPALTSREPPKNLMCLKDGDLREGDTSGQSPEDLRGRKSQRRSARGRVVRGARGRARTKADACTLGNTPSRERGEE